MSRNKTLKRPKLESGGVGGRFRYFVTRAILNIRQNVLVNVLTVGTIALALLIVALFLLVFINLEGAAENWSERVQVTVYFDKEPTPPELEALIGRVKTVEGTTKVSYVSPAEALKRFRGRLSGQEALLEGVDANVLPASLEIGLKKKFRESVALEEYVAKLKKVPGVSEVQYGEEWVRRFNAFLNFMRFIGALLGAFLLLAVLFIISNTIKLTIFSRKEEIELMDLVGATRFFIKAPFLVEGILQGAAGALIAILVLVGTYATFLHSAQNFISFNPATSGLSFLPPLYLTGIFISGVFLGFVGSLTSLRRFINNKL